MSDKQSFPQEVYEDVASFGRLMALLGLIFGIVLGIGLIIASIVLYMKKSKYTKKVTANVKSSTCTNYSNNNNLNYNCTLNVTYTTSDNKQIEKIIYTDSNINYIVGSTIELVYNPDDPSDIIIGNQLPNKMISLFLLIIGIFVIGGSWLWYWISRKSKFGASVYGVSSAVNLFRR